MQTEQDLATDGESADPYADLRNAKPWLDLIKESERCEEEYQSKCDSIDKLYANLKHLSSNENAEREMQIFWSNLEVLKPSIYSRSPVPLVGSRFKDRKEVNRHASELVERCLNTSFDLEDIHDTLKQVRDDLATNSRGVLWVRYEADQESERVRYDHIDRRDYRQDPARKWKEVGWVARRSYLAMEKMRARFEQPSGDAYIKAEYSERKDADDYSGERKAEVFELWSKDKGVVVWVTPNVDEVLDIQPPFLKLDGFFPCPRPAYGTLERGSLKPVPDFLYYKDQIEEINELTARISALAEALRMKGFYAAGSEDISTAIETAMKQKDNTALLIPIPSVAALGGTSLKDAIVWMPVDQIANVIQVLVQLRRQMIDDVYQITGLSDIMRGATDPNETLGAQQLKSQYGSVRVRERQEEMIRIARDAARIAGEIMAENFSPDTLMAMSQYDQLPTQAAIQQQMQPLMQQMQQMQMQAQQVMSNPQAMEMAQADPEQAQQMQQQFEQQLQQMQGQLQQLQQTVTLEQVMQLLQDQRMRPFTLEIETDSTIQPDEDAAKQRTTEFLGALSTALAQLAPMVQAQPQTSEFAGEVIKFAVTPFRAGRALEGAIDSFVDQMKQMAGQEKPDPEAERAQAEMQMEQERMKMDAQQAQVDAAAKAEQNAADLRKTDAEIQKIFAEIERIKSQADAAVQTAQAKANQPETVN